MGYSESGFKVEFEAGVYCFRLAESPIYLKLSGKGLKEMDFGWVQPYPLLPTSRLGLLELKRLHDPRNPEYRATILANPDTHAPTKAFLAGLVNKCLDTLGYLFSAELEEVSKGCDIRQQMSSLSSMAHLTPVRVYFLIMEDPERPLLEYRTYLATRILEGLAGLNLPIKLLNRDVLILTQKDLRLLGSRLIQGVVVGVE